MNIKFLSLLAALAGVHAAATTKYKKKVIVVGAGMSGLSAAVKLQEAGYDVSILEARKRVGGRINTKNIDAKDPKSAKFDFGASFIHGIEGGNPLVPLADAAKSKRYVPSLAQVFLPAYNKSPATLLDPEMSYGLAGVSVMAFESLAEYANAQKDSIDPKESIKAKAIEFLTGGLAQVQDKMPQVLDLVDVASVAELHGNIEGATLADFSLKYFGVEKSFSGDEPILLDGYNNLLTTFAKPVLDKVKLKHEVKSVQADKDGVQVSTTAGQTFKADAVVVTVPLGVLKANTISFKPPLPADKQQAIKKHGMGLLNKVVIKFKDLSWFPAIDMLILPPQLHPAPDASVDTKSTYINVWNLSLSYKLPYLCFFTYGPFADHIEGLSNDQVAKKVLGVLGKRLENVPTTFESVHVTRWRKDPHAGGSYSYVSVGSDGDKSLQAMAAPNPDKRVFWAGEHTTEYMASVHGAYMSGERAAEEVKRALK